MNPFKIGALVIAFLFVIVFLSNLFTVVGPTENVIVTRLGNINRVLTSGPHFMIPFIEDTVSIDMSEQKEEVDASAASKDLQTVPIKIAVNYQVNQESVKSLYLNTRGDYKSRLLAPAIQETVKSASAKYTAEELITKREQIRGDIINLLKEKLATSGIRVTNVSITDFDFSPGFNKSIEAKVTAEQDALAQKNKLEQVKYEAQQTIETAKAEAESIRIKAQAVTSQGGADYVKLQAINKWNGILPVQMIPNGTVPFIDVK